MDAFLRNDEPLEADDAFDLVVSLETFELWRNADYALAAVQQELRPSGRFLQRAQSEGRPSFLWAGLRGGIRKVIEIAYRSLEVFPYFCWWLWIFDGRNERERRTDPYASSASLTNPGPLKHFVPER